MNTDGRTARERAAHRGQELSAVVAIFPEQPKASRSGRLAGVPVAVKDLIDIAGHPRGNGNPHDMTRAPASVDAPVVALLRAVGADVFAATSLLEYAAGATHPAIPETRNPHDLSRTAGGSSGGSAALVGAGVCTLALGTDTGGAIRIPAHYCGVVGFKPSYGALPLGGVEPLSPTLDHVGFLTDTVAVALEAFLAMSGAERVITSGPLRIGVIADQLEATELEPDVAAAVRQAVNALRSNGCTIVEVDGSVLTELNQLFGDILHFEAWQAHGKQVTDNPDHYGPETLRLFQSAASVTRATYDTAMTRRRELLPTAARIYEGIDVLLSPAAPFVAPATTPPTDTADGEAEGMFTSVFNLTGDPAIVLPCGWSRDGVPIGVQLSTLIGKDAALLAAAAYVESTLAVPSFAPRTH